MRGESTNLSAAGGFVPSVTVLEGSFVRSCGSFVGCAGGSVNLRVTVGVGVGLNFCGNVGSSVVGDAVVYDDTVVNGDTVGSLVQVGASETHVSHFWWIVK